MNVTIEMVRDYLVSRLRKTWLPAWVLEYMEMWIKFELAGCLVEQRIREELK